MLIICRNYRHFNPIKLTYHFENNKNCAKFFRYLKKTGFPSSTFFHVELIKLLYYLPLLCHNLRSGRPTFLSLYSPQLTISFSCLCVFVFCFKIKYMILQEFSVQFFNRWWISQIFTVLFAIFLRILILN